MFQKPQTSSLNAEIERVLQYMETIDPSEGNYDDVVNSLSKLHALKVAETKKRISPDTWLTVGAHLVGIVLVLQYERTQIIPRTAMTFVQKLR